MLLESRVNPKTAIYIDCESVGGIDKSSFGGNTDPDKVMSTAVALARTMAEQLAQMAAGSVDGLEVSWALRVNSVGMVVIGQTPDAGQFRVTMRWSKTGVETPTEAT